MQIQKVQGHHGCYLNAAELSQKHMNRLERSLFWSFIPEFSSWKDHERVLNKATSYKEVVVITFCSTYCYLGTDGLTRRSEAWINALQYSGKISAIVHFGNPYAMQKINHIPRRIFGYMIPESQEYAIDVLAGKIEAKGKLPFVVELD